ncbi:MAG: SOS response-associated peptidase [Anaerolineaceae bacterium]|nr:SOS response-associated peptidase [Anaerolineaceae bacterium]
MCGRYTITFSADSAREDLGIVQMPEDYQPRHNVAPTQAVAVVVNAAERKAEWMRWGLIPYWAKDPSIGSKLINARSETISEKPAFKNAFNKRRCLVLADGFYEWKKGAGPKGRSQPYYFRQEDAKPFAFAGIWEFWRSPDAGEVRTCSIITCEANGLVKPVHERMPVILSGQDMWAWLSPDQPGDLLTLLKPYPAERMTAYQVSTQVNRPELDIPDLILPLAI